MRTRVGVTTEDPALVPKNASFAIMLTRVTSPEGPAAATLLPTVATRPLRV